MLNRLSATRVFDLPESETGFDLWGKIYFLWRHWKLITLVVGVSLALGALSLFTETPRYTANAQVLLDLRRDRVVANESFLQEPALDNAALESQLALIRSTVLLKRVVEREQLIEDPEFGVAPPEKPSVLQVIASYFYFLDPQMALTPFLNFFGRATDNSKAQSTQIGDPIISSKVMASIEALRVATGVLRSGQAHVFGISVTSTDPVRAAKLANAIASAYVVDKLDSSFEAAKKASLWLADRLTELRKQLRDSEEAVAKFRSEHGLVQSNASSTLSQQQLAEFNAKLVGAKAEVAEKKTRVDFLASIEKKGEKLLSYPDFITSSVLTNLRQQQAAISQREADLAARYEPQHPIVVNIRAERRDVERGIAAETQRLAANIKNEYDLAQARLEAAERSLREATGQTSIDDTTAITLRELERTAAVNKSLFESFLQKAKVTEEQSTFEARDVRVITPAVPPGVPSFPKKGQTMIYALIIGLLLGGGGAVTLEMLNAGFTSPRQLEDALGIPLLASVGHVRDQDLTVDGKRIDASLIPVLKPLSRYSEAMRALRIGIQMSDVDDPPKVIQITSALPGEGKTTIALSIAASAAISGLRVLFIDADLRHPSASHALGLQQQLGLVNVLLGQVKAEDAVRFDNYGKFWVVSAGTDTYNPADLLGSDRMKAQIANFKNSFDLIVIDSSPVGAVTDSIVISQLADKVVFVVRWSSTARDVVRDAVSHFPGDKSIAGVVFNLVDEDRAQKYGGQANSVRYNPRYFKNYYAE
jgi:succinoglycan biosynthesis transport protein ExoP